MLFQIDFFYFEVADNEIFENTFFPRWEIQKYHSFQLCLDDKHWNTELLWRCFWYNYYKADMLSTASVNNIDTVVKKLASR